jgi:hypothetical protein
MSKNNLEIINELFKNQVTYNYIPKMDNKIGIDNINFITELKTVEKGNCFKYGVAGFNILYFYLLLEQKFFSLKKFKPLMILILPVGLYSYGMVTSRSQINRILDPLFKEEFEIYKSGKNKSHVDKKSDKDNYIDYFNKILNKNPSSKPAAFLNNNEKNKLYDHLNFITEWLYEPLDLDFENKLYFINNSEKSIDDEISKKGHEQFLGLRYKKI